MRWSRYYLQGALVLSGVALIISSTTAQSAHVARSQPQRAELSGVWSGAGWGRVVLEADGSGSYTDIVDGPWTFAASFDEPTSLRRRVARVAAALWNARVRSLP